MAMEWAWHLRSTVFRPRPRINSEYQKREKRADEIILWLNQKEKCLLLLKFEQYRYVLYRLRLFIVQVVLKQVFYRHNFVLIIGFSLLLVDKGELKAKLTNMTDCQKPTRRLKKDAL